MSAHSQPRLTPQQYLEMERDADVRSEYYLGQMYSMAGGSPEHAFIIGNLVRRLGNALEESPCRVASSDLRVCTAPEGLYTYPDIVVVCGPLTLLEGDTTTVLNPTLIVEVLSPSTEGYNRGFKAQKYRTVESLQEYALVSQTEPRVEIFRRQSAGDWLLSESIGLKATCRFDSVGCEIPLAQIYAKISFDDPAA